MSTKIYDFLKRNALMSSLCVVFIFALAFVVYAYTSTGLRHEKIMIGGNTFKVEVADTEALQMKGLSGHTPLGQGEGMLFVFPQAARYGFWMKDMQFPIDIVWIDASGNVVHIERNLSPETYPQTYFPDGPVLYAIEIAALETTRLNIKNGDQFKIK